MRSLRRNLAHRRLRNLVDEEDARQLNSALSAPIDEGALGDGRTDHDGDIDPLDPVRACGAEGRGFRHAGMPKHNLLDQFGGLLHAARIDHLGSASTENEQSRGGDPAAIARIKPPVAEIRIGVWTPRRERPAAPRRANAQDAVFVGAKPFSILADHLEVDVRDDVAGRAVDLGERVHRAEGVAPISDDP